MTEADKEYDYPRVLRAGRGGSRVAGSEWQRLFNTVGEEGPPGGGHWGRDLSLEARGRVGVEGSR